ncbi:hypothetical protein GCM10010234_15490 [Streptomyces hawaiiensis]
MVDGERVGFAVDAERGPRVVLVVAHVVEDLPGRAVMPYGPRIQEAATDTCAVRGGCYRSDVTR